ncbi:YihY/virulence factor BrkB family protein [Altericista sp. CCNU0014]|uniref:YihY/virulence factor BrkB family protein n=1 Tax=Altericista sp. CCNU0014 TaxID=3082949 RepID=UPI00384B94A3
MNFKQLWRLLRQTFKAWNEDKASRLAAALAYYTVFSLTPLISITLTIVGVVFGQEAARGEIVAQMQGLVGRQSAQAIETAIANISQDSLSGLASILNIGVLLFAASGVFTELQGALNTIWEVAPKPGKAIRVFIHQRLLAFLMVMAIGLLLLASLMLNTFLVAISSLFVNFLPGGSVPWQLLNTIGSFIITTLLFGLIYKYLPQAKIAWSDVWIGALMTATLFSIGKFALGFYLGHNSFSSAFGAAGSLVFVVAWVFYSAQILFFGAEFTHAYAKQYGSHIRPRKYAVALTEEDRVQQGIPHREYVEGLVQQTQLQDSALVDRAKVDLIPRFLQLGLSLAEIAEGLDLPVDRVKDAARKVNRTHR